MSAAGVGRGSALDRFKVAVVEGGSSFSRFTRLRTRVAGSVNVAVAGVVEEELVGADACVRSHSDTAFLSWWISRLVSERSSFHCGSQLENFERRSAWSFELASLAFP